MTSASLEDHDITSLVAIDADSALAVFTTPGKIEPILAKVRAVVDQFEGDVTTNAGRKRIASMAHRIAKAKTLLDDGVGKTLAAEQKEIPKKIDATRRLIRETLDAWRDEVRAPLEAWELAESARIKRHRDVLAMLATLPGLHKSATELRDALAQAETIEPDEHEEFAKEIGEFRDFTINTLRQQMTLVEKREAEAAELERLRAEDAKRRAEEAAEQLRKEGEARAAKAAAERAERERVAAEAAIKAAEAKAAQAERDAANAKARAEAEVAAKARAEAEAAAKREANIKHRKSVIADAHAALVAAGVPSAFATVAMQAICENKVPSVRISF